MYIKKYLLLLIPFISCSVTPVLPAGSQKIQIRFWKNQTPNFLFDTELRVDISKENVIDFDATHIENDIYVVYTTDKKVMTAINVEPGNPLLGFFTPPIADPVPGVDEILELRQESSIKGNSVQNFVKRRVYDMPSDSWQTNEVLRTATTLPSKTAIDTWVRVLRGSRNGTGFVWKLLYASEDPLIITNVKYLNIPGVEGAFAGIEITNGQQKVMAMFNNGSTFERIDDIGIFNKKTATKITDLNTWTVGERVYLTAIFDNSLTTGYIASSSSKSTWTQTYNATLPFHSVTHFQVVPGINNVYSTWIINNDILQILKYDENQPVSRRWLKLDDLSAVKNPVLKVERYIDIKGQESETVLLGTAHKTRSFFQLYDMEVNQLLYHGPIIDDWNDRYAFAANDRNHVLYARAEVDGRLIFAGLNSLNFWEPILISSPPKIRIHPLSKINTFFQAGIFPLIFFKQENGSMYILEGML